MGYDYFYNRASEEEAKNNRGIFFTQISREKLSKKNHVSKEKYISKNPDKIIFKTDLLINNLRKYFSKDISSFLSPKKNNFLEKSKIDDLPDKKYSTSLNSTTEDIKKDKYFNSKSKYIFSI